MALFFPSISPIGVASYYIRNDHYHYSIKNFSWDLTNGPRSVSCDRAIRSGQIITTSADVTLNGGLIRELPQNPLNSGLGIILICPD